ncbi:MAG: type II toxin-antitoxin system VapC family toxin [Rhodocyclaceae bacterium]|nr:type II toxin-antitoxin system VapC family toxin [Rhodocyclaceae bacterium]
MRVIDTSAWIEWLIDSPLRERLAQEIPARAQCIVPTLVQFELAKWPTREVGEEAADQMIAYTQQCVVAPLDTRLALLAADLHRQYRLATADAVVYATAREWGADLLTCDSHFAHLPGVVLIPKTPASAGRQS